MSNPLASVQNQVEGHHSSFLEGLRKRDIERCWRAISSVGGLLRTPEAKQPALKEWRETMKHRWQTYNLVLRELEVHPIWKGPGARDG